MMVVGDVNVDDDSIIIISDESSEDHKGEGDVDDDAVIIISSDSVS